MQRGKEDGHSKEFSPSLRNFVKGEYFLVQGALEKSRKAAMLLVRMGEWGKEPDTGHLKPEWS